MTLEDVEYYRQRAASERQRALQASSAAAEIHLKLACLYERLVELEEQERQNGTPLTLVS